MNRKFELSSLSDFICRALMFTEAVKDTLQFECAEARFSLKPWITKTLVAKEVDKNDCICNKVQNLIYIYIFFFMSQLTWYFVYYLLLRKLIRCLLKIKMKIFLRV